MRGFQHVAAYVPPGATALGLGVTSGIFGANATQAGFALELCARTPGAVRTDLGVTVAIEHGIEALERADLVLLLPGAEFRAEPDGEVVAGLRAAAGRGATIAAHCTGTFLLADTGLLDGLEATTHWQFADELREKHPAINVRPNALYVDEGSIVTGAGAAAGIDMCLHLVRREHGATLANSIARGLVVPPHREGGQSQYIDAAVTSEADGGHLSEVIAWARANLDRRLSVDGLATRALMSRRSFARHFTAATGEAPHAWLTAQRLALAEQLLETTPYSIEEIASRVGYSSAAVLREQFVRRRGIPPRDYRRRFTRDTDPRRPE